MTTINNITTITMNMNIYNNTDQIINPNPYIPTKVCNTCRTIKKLTEFYKNNTSKDGNRSQCTTCTNTRRKNIMMIIRIY